MAAKESASSAGSTKERSSAEVWYSGYSPCGVRDSRPKGRSKPMALNWRSS